MPEITRFGSAKTGDSTCPDGVTWFDINIGDKADHEWLMAWQEISEQTRTALLEPVRFSHYEQVPEGTLLSMRTLRTGAKDDQTDLTDLVDFKLLIGPTTAITLRSGKVAAVDQLRQNLPSNRSLVTAVDLLGFMVTGMTNRMEPIIFDLIQDIDDVEDAMLDGGLVPPQQTLSEFQRRIFRTRRQVNYTQQVLDPMTTDPTLALDADDRETLVRASKHVTRYLQRLDECRTRVQALGEQIQAQRSEIMTRSSLNLTIVATVFLPLTFITGLLGMNVAGIPDQHNPYGFWLVTGLSIFISMLVWLLLRRQTFSHYPDQAGTANKKSLRLPETTAPAAAGMISAADEDTREQSTQSDLPPDTEDRAHRPGEK
jgi:Mg2+ and Co2+ transporter CorA